VQRTGFCTMGAVSDAVVIGDFTRLRQWALAAAVATLGFAALAASGVLAAPQTSTHRPAGCGCPLWWAGGLFGFGMVLSSGCVSKTLVRVGGGSLKSLVVMLVAGLTGFATLKVLTPSGA
jgi:uncharacterized membrane protein YedE/YeeE